MTKIEPEYASVTALKDGSWGWCVWFAPEVGGFDQDGKARSLEEALECVKSAIENARG